MHYKRIASATQIARYDCKAPRQDSCTCIPHMVVRAKCVQQHKRGGITRPGRYVLNRTHARSRNSNLAQTLIVCIVTPRMHQRLKTVTAQAPCSKPEIPPPVTCVKPSFAPST